jgi:hypothetical protein
MRTPMSIRVALLALAVAGCTGGKASPAPTGPPSPTPPATSATMRPSPSATPTASPTATPTPVPSGFVQAESGIVWNAGNGEQLAVPTIPGLTATLADGKAIYVANSGNPYGLKSQAYAGEFKPNLVLEQPEGTERQTGVAVLVGPVAGKLTREAHNSGQFRMAIPIDLRSQQGNVTVSSGIGPNASIPRVAVEILQEANIVEGNPYNEGAFATVEDHQAVNYEIGDYSMFNDPPNSVPDGQELTYVHLYAYGSDGHLIDVTHDLHLTKPVEVGTPIAKVSAGKVSIGCYTAAVVSRSIDLYNVLRTSDGTPVAIAAS